MAFVIVFACGCTDRRQRAIELNNEGVRLMDTFRPDSMDMALALFDKAIALDSMYGMAYANKVECMIRLNRRPETIHIIKRYIQIADSRFNRMEGLFALGRTYDIMGDSVKADCYFRKALDMEPEVMKEVHGDLYKEFDFVLIKHLLGMDKDAEERFGWLQKKYKDELDSTGWNFLRDILKVERRALLKKDLP